MTTFTPVTVTLNGFVFGSGTPDGDGILWDWQELAGWFDTPDVRVEQGEVQPMGSGITIARRNARAISLTVLAHDEVNFRQLNDNIYAAQHTLFGSCDGLDAPILLEVDDPALGDTLQAYVRGVGPIRTKIIGTRHMVQFLLPLVAPDPRRYLGTASSVDFTITGTGTTATHNVTNNGDEFTPHTLTVVGPAVNPQIEDLTNGFSVIWANTLTGGQTLVFDQAARTVTVNGVDARSSLTTAQWWQLAAGTTSVRYRRTSGASTSVATLAYRDAYR